MKRVVAVLGSLVGALLLVLADQRIKLWALGPLQEEGPFTVIPEWLRFIYVENRGAAFNLFNGKKVFLLALSAVLTVGLLIYIYSLWDLSVKAAWTVWLSRICATLILGGALGNIYDRIFRGFVVDYIEVLFIRFPVFNLADCLIVGGCILLLAVLLIEESMLAKNKKKQKEIRENGDE